MTSHLTCEEPDGPKTSSEVLKKGQRNFGPESSSRSGLDKASLRPDLVPYRTQSCNPITFEKACYILPPNIQTQGLKKLSWELDVAS